MRLQLDLVKDQGAGIGNKRIQSEKDRAEMIGPLKVIII